MHATNMRRDIPWFAMSIVWPVILLGAAVLFFAL
jgi:ATP/ADP translocase